jgi:Lon protease-like protein
MAEMPMFPLGTVLLPGRILTVHVFEPRYREMVRHCVAADRHEFGVVLIERGSEVGGGDHRRTVGTVAQMVQVAETPDGRYAVVGFGTRRIRVNRWLDDDPFPLADVDEWPDEPSAQPSTAVDLMPALTQRVRRATALALELGDPVGDPAEDVNEDPALGSHQLAGLAPLCDADRYELLCAPDAQTRLALLDRMLADLEPVLQFRLQQP